MQFESLISEFCSEIFSQFAGNVEKFEPAWCTICFRVSFALRYLLLYGTTAVGEKNDRVFHTLEPPFVWPRILLLLIFANELLHLLTVVAVTFYETNPEFWNSRSYSNVFRFLDFHVSDYVRLMSWYLGYSIDINHAEVLNLRMDRSYRHPDMASDLYQF